MSPNVDTNLIDLIEQTIEKITTVENEENQKLRNKESSQEDVYNVNYNKINPSGSFWVMAKHEGFGVPIMYANNNDNIFNKNEDIYGVKSNGNKRQSNTSKINGD
jgi:hypothetical protein